MTDNCVIFITEHDVLNGNRPLYVIDRCIKGLDQPFNDGAHIIYVNGEDRDSSTDLGRLMHDFFCVDPKDMHYKVLAERASYFKNSEEGVTSMCKAMEDMRNEAALRRTKEIALRMIVDGTLSLEKITEFSGLPLEVIKELAQQKTAYGGSASKHKVQRRVDELKRRLFMLICLPLAVSFLCAAVSGADSGVFSDVPEDAWYHDAVDTISSYARDAMGWAVASELMKGVSETELSPWGTATRAQTAMILARFLSFTAEEPAMTEQPASNGGSEAEKTSEAEATPLPTVPAAEREPELPLTE